MPDRDPYRAPGALEQSEPRPLSPPPGEGEGPPAAALTRVDWAVLTFGMVVCVAFADHVTRTDLQLILFYLAPIGLGAWFTSLRWGLLLAVLSSVGSFAADLLYRAQVSATSPGTALLVWNAFMLLGTALALVATLTALKGRLEAEEHLARTDALTRIPNRRAFFEAAAMELERARRSGKPLTVAYLDVDDFKLVNDRMGHAAGDTLLLTVARTLRGTTRAVDSVARLGGDEFGLILPETDAAVAEAILQRVRGTLLEAIHQESWAAGFSIGAAVFLVPPSDVDELTARADELMYMAKRSAKGSLRIGVFEGPQVWASAVPR